MDSKARTEVGWKKVEGSFERKMNQPDLPEGYKSMLAEMKELSLAEKKAGKAGASGGAKSKPWTKDGSRDKK